MAGKPHPREHGTIKGYKQHEYYKEPKCRPCLDARAAKARVIRKQDHYVQYRKEYYERTREHQIERNRIWKEENADKVREYVRKRYSEKKEEINSVRREYYKNNKDRILEKNKQWAKDNNEKINEYRRRYRKANLEAARARGKLWYDTNREKIRTVYRRRRNDRYGYGFEREPYSVQEVIATYGSDCHICNKPIDLNQSRKPGVEGWENALHIDHVIPLVAGGPDKLDNVRPAHGLCNLSKGDKLQGY